MRKHRGSHPPRCAAALSLDRSVAGVHTVPVFTDFLLAKSRTLRYFVIKQMLGKREEKALRTVNEEARQAKKIEIMEKSYDCYAENGLNGVGVKAVAEACGCNVATLYQYFENLDSVHRLLYVQGRR